MDWLKKATELKARNQAFVVASITEIKGSTPREVGSQMLIEASGSFCGTIGGGNLEKLVIEKAQDLLNTKVSQKVQYPLSSKAEQCCGGWVEIFFSVHSSLTPLYVFGAGHVGQAVVRVLKDSPFQIHLVDARVEWLSQISDSSVVIHTNYDSLHIRENSYVAIMTHSHDLDFEILKKAIQAGPKYLGLIGSETKWQRFSERLMKENFTKAQIESVWCPFGLPIGGKSPTEVAVSLAAQILQMHHEAI